MATKNIKGITIEIDGNTQPLSNALKDLNKDIKAVDKEIKSVDQALKLDPGNTEQVARKLELLEEKAELAEKKVERLKDAQKQMDAQGVDKASKEYQSLTTEIVKAEGAFKDIKTQIDRTKTSFNEVSEGSKQLQTFLNATGQTADDLTSILGSKLVDAIKSGQLGAAGYQTVLNKLSQELTGTAKNADLLKNALSGSSLEDAKQSLNQLTTSAQDYRTKITDLEQAQNRLNTYFQATGTTVKDFSNILGTELTSKIESGKASSQELATALDKIGASALENSGDIDKFKATLDSVDSGVSFDRINNELNNLGSEFNQDESKIDSFKNKLESIASSSAASAIADVSEQVGELGEKFTEFGEGAIEAAGTVESSQNQIRIALGATEEEAAAVAEHSKNVFNQNFGETQEEVTNVMVEIQKSIQGVNDSNIEDITSKFMTLKQAGVDEDDAIRGVKSSMEAWGLTAEQALDLMTTGMQNVYDPAHELGDIMGEYSPLMEQSGYSATEFLTALKEGMDNGAYSVDKVADLIKEMGIRISDGSIASAVTDLDQQFQGMGVNFEQIFTSMSEKGASNKEIFNALVQEINKLPDSTSQAAAASALFGTQGEDAGMRVLNAVAGAGDEFSNFSGAADKARDANETAVGSMEAKWRALGQAFAPIGEDLAELANKILDVLVPAVQGFADWLTNLPAPIKGVIEVVGAVIAGLTALAPVIGVIVNVINLAMPVISAIGAAISVVWNVISAGFTILTALGSALGTIVTAIGGVIATIGAPLIAAIGAVVAVVVGLIAYFNNWGGCADWLNEKWSQFISWLGEAFSGLGDSIGGLWNAFLTELQTEWNTILEGIKSIFTAAGTWLSDNFNSVKDNLTNIWNNLCNGIGDLWNKAKDNLSNIGNTLKDNLTNTWNSLKDNSTSTWNNLKDNATNIWENIKSTITDKAQNIKDGLSAKWNEIVNDFSNIWNGIQNTASQIWENVKNIVANGINALKNLMNFNWSLPKIKLPHFRISGSFSLNPPSVPSIGIDWYKKGGILTAPTIFGMNGNSLLGGGEAGKEAVAPIDTLTGYVEDAVNNSNSELKKELSEIKELLSTFCNAALNKTFDINIDGRSIASAIVPQIDSGLGYRQKLKARQ